MSHPAPALPMKGALALKVFIFFAFAYVLSYAFRSVNAVIAPELMADLKINNLIVVSSNRQTIAATFAPNQVHNNPGQHHCSEN